MSKSSTSSSTFHVSPTPLAAMTSKRAASSAPSADHPARAKLLLVDFRSGEAVRQHPDVAPLLKDGWSVTGAAPRVTPEGTRLLVVLAPPGSSPGLAARRFGAPVE